MPTDPTRSTLPINTTTGQVDVAVTEPFPGLVVYEAHDRWYLAHRSGATLATFATPEAASEAADVVAPLADWTRDVQALAAEIGPDGAVTLEEALRRAGVCCVEHRDAEAGAVSPQSREGREGTSVPPALRARLAEAVGAAFVDHPTRLVAGITDAVLAVVQPELRRLMDELDSADEEWHQLANHTDATCAAAQLADRLEEEVQQLQQQLEEITATRSGAIETDDAREQIARCMDELVPSDPGFPLPRPEDFGSSLRRSIADLPGPRWPMTEEAQARMRLQEEFRAEMTHAEVERRMRAARTLLIAASHVPYYVASPLVEPMVEWLEDAAAWGTGNPREVAVAEAVLRVAGVGRLTAAETHQAHPEKPR